VIIWGAYSTYSSYKEEIPTYMIGVYCGIAAVICLVLHYALEKTMVPTFAQGSMTIVLGLVGPGLAYQLWDYGMKFGNARLLSVSCYFARVMSMALLVWFGKEPFSSALVVACGLAIAGVFISTVDERWLKDILFGRFKRLFGSKKLVERSQLV
jgi:drug/metabolite transporter (DMT)-like permease